MARTLQVKRGLQAALPTLAEGEFGFTLDQKRLYIGHNAGNIDLVSSSVNVSLSTTWSGSGPYTQNVTIAGMTASTNATVGLASTATRAQREAARNAIFNVTSQTTNRITITADGDKPTITIPISVILMP